MCGLYNPFAKERRNDKNESRLPRGGNRRNLRSTAAKGREQRSRRTRRRDMAATPYHTNAARMELVGDGAPTEPWASAHPGSRNNWEFTVPRTSMEGGDINPTFPYPQLRSPAPMGIDRPQWAPPLVGERININPHMMWPQIPDKPDPTQLILRQDPTRYIIWHKR